MKLSKWRRGLDQAWKCLEEKEERAGSFSAWLFILTAWLTLVSQECEEHTAIKDVVNFFV